MDTSGHMAMPLLHKAMPPRHRQGLEATMRLESRRRALSRRLWFWVGFLLFLWANYGWVMTRLDHLANPTLITVTGDIANWCAFNGLVLFLGMCWMGSRNVWLEKSFGLDEMLLTHRKIAMVTVVAFSLHAVLRTWSISMSEGMVYDFSLLYRMRLDEWPLTMGRVAFYLMVACTGLAFLGQKYQKLRFKQWKRPHLLFYPIFAMGMVHGMLWGNDMGLTPLREFWWMVLTLFLADGSMRLWHVGMVRRRQRWSIETIHAEADHTVTASFAQAPGGLSPSPFARRMPGQFGVLRIPSIKDMDEPHPFTLSGAALASGSPLQCTVKEAGDFTRAFLHIAPQTMVRLEGPYGKFLHDVWQHKRLALLAGGVGVTPFLSLLRSFRDCGEHLPTVFIWSNRSRADVFAVGELAKMCQVMPLTVVHCLSRETQERVSHIPSRPGTHWVSGRLDNKVAEEWLTGDEGFYACGPENWLAGTLSSLQQAHGVAPNKVQREHFFW